jgi:NNP family nitrate/nitrite transporter-like MFS transporter
MTFFKPAPVYGFSAGDKLLLGAVATLIGGCARIPYSMGIAAFGGRNWTAFSTFVLLIPTVGTVVLVANPGLPLWPYVGCAALAGLGGGNYAASLANVNAFYPERLKGRQSYLSSGTETSAYWLFLVSYFVAAIRTWTLYVHRPASAPSVPDAEPARV